MTRPSGHPKESNYLRFRIMYLDKNNKVYLRWVNGRSIHKYREERRRRHVLQK